MAAGTSAACVRARLPTHQIVGMGEAFRIATAEMADEIVRIRGLRDRLVHGLQEMEEVYVNGDLEHRVPHNLNISFNLRRGRVADHGDQGTGGVVRVGLHLGQPGAVLRVARVGPQRRIGA